MIPEITPRELAEKLKTPHPPLMIDVREPHEYAHCHIAGAHLHPLGGIATWAATLDPATETVLLCHSGYRSLHAAHYLQQRGFTQVLNLRGGIDAWSVDVDPSVPRY